jgi:hypothetical protein
MRRELTYKEVELDIEFDYQPEEPMVMYYKDGSGDPGCPSEATITDIKIGKINVWQLLEDQIEDIEKELLEDYEESMQEER